MDPRVGRTKDALRASILDQIQRKRWEKITVQDLLDQTGISRSTFYAHYDNKLAVLTDEIPSVADTIRIDASKRVVDLQPLFAHVDEMAPILHPLLSQPVLREINDNFEREFAGVFRALVEDNESWLPEFLAGALISSVRQYAAQRVRRPPDEVAAEISTYINTPLKHPTKSVVR